MKAQGTSDLKILVVDDNATMRSILSYQLGQMGIDQVREAVNGRQAMDMLADASISRPDAILCDLHMDEMDGLQFCNAFRRDEALQATAIPIIIVTADDDKLAHEVAEQVGAKAVLAKPFTVEQLRDQLQRAVGYEIALVTS